MVWPALKDLRYQPSLRPYSSTTLAAGLFALFLSFALHARASTVVWREWSDAIFAQAAQEHKFVLLNLRAPWCRWCHAMDQQTYRDPAVLDLLAKRYIAVNVDADERPDLRNRYDQYDLPLTVVFNSDRSEIVRKQGYQSSRGLASLLQAVIDDPSPAGSVTAPLTTDYASSPEIAPALLGTLNNGFEKQYDVPDNLVDFEIKCADPDSLQYARILAGHGEKGVESDFVDTLDSALHLIDPVWGGAWQSLIFALPLTGSEGASRYARVQIGGRPDTSGDSWNDPHFEKKLVTQAQAIRVYARAYAEWHKPSYLKALHDLHRYVQNFLSAPEGAFYASQDGELGDGGDASEYFALDDASRRAKGIPQIDTNLYARDNGWMIRALCELYAVTQDQSALDEAIRAAKWTIGHRSLKGGGFAHDEQDGAGPYLGDTLAMGEAFLALYQVNADEQWLRQAEAAAEFIFSNFPGRGKAGFVTSVTSTDAAYQTVPQRDENASLARFANLLDHYSERKSEQKMAERAMCYLATPEIANAGLSADVLLAHSEFLRAPLRVTIVGSRDDPQAQALYSAALRAGLDYKLLEWRAQFQASDFGFPVLPGAAAYLSSTATPVTDPKVLEQLAR
jgi:uncharacterized protein